METALWAIFFLVIGLAIREAWKLEMSYRALFAALDRLDKLVSERNKAVRKSVDL